MAILQLEQIKKNYQLTEVIHGIDINIDNGEFIVIVGPSGCGKSTLLRMIAGLEDISSGTMRIDGNIINNLSPKNRDIAMVFQNYALYPHMSVYDNMAYGLKMRKKSKAEILKRVNKAAELLELSHLLKRKPRELSGGQRQRVAMGRAIVRQPALFLFDEPLSNLDAKLRVQMRLEIRRLQKQLGTTSIYVTHDQVEAMTLADRLIVLNKGYAEQIGSPISIYEKPATVFVAGFIGSPAMNFLNATVTDNGLSLEIEGGSTIHLLHPKALTVGEHITVGIRPEHIHCTPVEQDDNSLPFIVDYIETLGADTLVYGHLPNNNTLITVRLAGHQRPETGHQLHVTLASEQLHLFDASNGKRLE